MKKKKRTIGILLLLAVLILCGVASSLMAKNPKIRLLMGIVHFSEVTLKQSDYLLKDIDIMEVCHDYLNGDTEIEGKAGLSNMQTVKSSIFTDIYAKRSFEQKKLSIHSSVDLLWMNAGDMNVYAEDDTIYLEAPMLGDDVGFALPTGISFFAKAPDLTSDINKAWFREHATDIVNLMQEVAIEYRGKKDDRDCFVITIPQGKGKFIWDLFGMEMPDFDVVVTEYLTDKNHITGIEMDLSDILPGAGIAVSGDHLEKCEAFFELPENEHVKVKMSRKSDEKDTIHSLITYETNTNLTYKATYKFTWQNADNGFTFKLKDMKMTREEELLMEGFFKGELKSVKHTKDLFDGFSDSLRGFEVVDWREVRDNTEEFVQEVLQRTSMSVFLDEEA